MDLRPLITSARQIEAARHLALRGLLSYQPYIFSDNFAVGAGLSILAGHAHQPPAVYCLDASAKDTDPTFYSREFAKKEQRDEFFSANAAMRLFYDGMVDQIAKAVGPLDSLSVLDVGCNTGYFPLSFARRGVRQATGIDRIDYSPTVALLNEICGTSVQFAPWDYDGSLVASKQYDLVLSIAVLVHLSEPLRHLAWLGSSARKALMVFTPAHDVPGERADVAVADAAPDYSIRFHAVNRYYEDAKFPLCFDITTISEPLLRLALEAMGFTRIVRITAAHGTMPAPWARQHVGLLGIREDAALNSGLTSTPTLSTEIPSDSLRNDVDEQMSELRSRVDRQAARINSLELTLNERTNRLRGLELTMEERTNRLATLEAVRLRSGLWQQIRSFARRTVRGRRNSSVQEP